MDATARLARATLEEAHRTLIENLRGVSLAEALQSAGGYRSILGITKHVAGWSSVYFSYAFEAEPTHWEHADWPHGRRDHIEPTMEYLDILLAWLERSYQRWVGAVALAADFDAPRPVHWGAETPLADIVVMVAAHWVYHAGEINAILAIQRGEAWEYGEEVEENHISTIGHRVRPSWMTDQQAARYQATE